MQQPRCTGAALASDENGGGDLRARSIQAPFVYTPQQSSALDLIDDWYRSSDKLIFYLGGYAGTGKTTLLQEIARRCGGRVIFGAFTAKAASVMRAKGCCDADTLDSLIYTRQRVLYCANDPPCKKLCKGRCKFLRERFTNKIRNEESTVADADLTIIDEVSMVGKPMAYDLLSFRTPTLVVGDPGQLPPIGDAGYFVRREPDFLLSEVHRQAEASPIIKLATAARKGERQALGNYGEGSAIVEDISRRELLNFDQIIVGTHRKRHAVNRQCRRELGFAGEVPEPGEKVVCLKNDRNKGLRNGTLWTVLDIKPDARGFLDMHIEDEQNRIVEVVAPVDGFTSHDGNGSELPGNPFAFGYAITCHKAQGSQWDSVLVYDESQCFRADKWRWLYTAITRAAESVVVVR
jgi:exodeoxyribonuclease-5